jgi:beta-lactam-binding protein with PASTA domain
VGGAPIEPEFDEPRGGGSAWTWIAGILALLVLLLAGAAAALFLSRGFGFGAGSSSVPDVRVPSFIGQQLAAAQQAAQGYGVQLAIGDIASPGQGQADNTIIAQNMTAGTSVPRGTTILVTIVKGTGTVAVPNIIGLPEQQALATLTQNDLKPGARSQRYDPTAPKGQVVDQAPTQGQVVVPGSPVNYWVSQGPEPTPTPTATPSPTPAPPSPAPTELPTPTPTPEITPPPSVGPSPSPLPS